MPALRRPIRPGPGLLIVLAFALSACVVPLPEPDGVTPAPTQAPNVASPVAIAPPIGSQGLDPDSGLPLVDLAALPPEASQVIGLIGAGGPFPYAQDGAVFENREGILPDADVGYYHEYTVPTPGSSDRGARRIVIANQGEAYWTDDHYASFSRIAP